MGRLEQRLAAARRALQTLLRLPLQEADPDDVVRDAAIQRFEYAFETLWKASQTYLRENEGVEAGSPKAAIRALFRLGLLGEDQVRQALDMADDRNLTVHTYNEELARSIFGRLKVYARLMQDWLAALEKGAD